MGVDEATVRTTWRAVAPPGPASERAREALMSRYREPHRRYHTLTHLAAVLTTVERLLPTTASTTHADADAVRWAALYHDAVYDPRASTNEAASAELADRTLAELGIAATTRSHVRRLVLATAAHEPVDATDDPAAAVLLDADLAVLGERPAVYQAYVRGVRAEYAHVDDDAWRRGRAAVVRSFLTRTVIYTTAAMAAEREVRARANLEAELAALGAG